MRVIALFALGLASAAASADDGLDLLVDVRLIASDGRTSYLDGGLGKLRFDEDHDGLQVGRLRAAWSQDFGERWNVHADGSLWRFDDSTHFDITEAYLEFRPYPASGWRSRLEVGATYLPVSLEHRAAGWTNPYLISSSAINTWVGEELRTIGAEYSLEWLGTRTGSDFDVGVDAAVYGWNDPAGVLVASRGWTLHDRQTTLFDKVGQPGEGPVPGRVLFKEIDDRPGYWMGAHLRYLDRVEMRYLHYDNRADPEAYDAGIHDYAWLTRFDSLGIRAETAGGWTFIAQWLDGDTSIEPESGYEVWDFDSTFVLVSKAWGPHRVSARVDWFETDHVRTSWPPPVQEDGTGFAAGYSYDFDEHWHCAVEFLQIRSDVGARAYLGEPTAANERQLQLQIRYER
jgi:hypothetical protein